MERSTSVPARISKGQGAAGKKGQFFARNRSKKGIVIISKMNAIKINAIFICVILTSNHYCA